MGEGAEASNRDIPLIKVFKMVQTGNP